MAEPRESSTGTTTKSNKKPFSYALRDQEFFNYAGFSEEYRENLIAQFADDIERLGDTNATKCMAVGVGNGIREVNIARALLPNLKYLTVFMPDDEEHGANIKQTFERELPGVEVTVIEKPLSEFVVQTDSGEFKNSFDAVLMIHVLYYLRKEERHELYRILFQDILRPGGLLIVEQNACSRMQRFADLLEGPIQLIKGNLYRKEILKYGFQLLDMFKYTNKIRFTEVFRREWSHILGKQLTKEEYDAANDKMFPADNPAECRTQQMTMLFCKPRARTDVAKVESKVED
jgi:SAM-dependent methyltransferase